MKSSLLRMGAFVFLVGCGGSGGGGGPGNDAGMPMGGDGGPTHDGTAGSAAGTGGTDGGPGGAGGLANLAGHSGSAGSGGAGGGSGSLGTGGGAGSAGGAGGGVCPAISVCVQDALRCEGGAPQKCVVDGRGCLVWQAAAACGAHQVCSSGVCTCADDARCGAPPREGDFCPTAGGTTFGHCAKDSNGCIFVSATANPCSGTDTCNASGVVETGSACGCPADGATLGTGCSSKTVGNTIADAASGLILRCEAVGTCQVWKVQVDCGATGLTVGSINGVDVCVCRPPAGGVYHVDPDPPMAVFMNGSPTGAHSPAACRLRSITDALARIAAGPGFNKVVVSHEAAPPVHLGVSTGEVFPLTIPAGITVTSGDGILVEPSRYVIDVAAVGADPCAVKLGDGALMSGFTVDTSGASGTAHAGAGVENVVSCFEPQSAQTARAEHLVIAARPTQTGVLVGGACALTLNDVTVKNALIGVDVVRTSTGTSAEASLISSRGLDISSTVPGALGLRVGAGLDGGARSSATVAGIKVATCGVGIMSDGGNITLDGGQVTATNTATESALGADIAKGTVLIKGTHFSGASRFTGIQLSATAQVTLTSNAAGPTRVTTTLAANDPDSSAGVVLAAGATAAQLVIAGGTQISKFHTGLVVHDGSFATDGAHLTINDNRGNGLELLGRTAGAVVTVSGGTVRDNAGSGVVVRTTGPSTVRNLVISGNGQDGVDVQRTQTAAQSGYRLVLASNTVSANQGRGIALTGKGIGAGGLLGGKVGVRVERNTVSSNGGVGIHVTESEDAADGDDITEVSLDGNDVGGNLTAAATAPGTILAGGVFFARTDATTRVLLGSFLGNRIHGNGRHEVGFDLVQDGGAAWNLSSSVSAVDMATGCAETARPNVITCYDTVPGQDHAVAVASSAIHVNVQNMHFQNELPVAGRDYSLAISPAEITAPCAPRACQ